MNTSRPVRPVVLIAQHGDGFSQAFADNNVDVKYFDVPFCPGSEDLAEDTFELMLPHRYRQLYWPNKVRASAMHRPLMPSTMARSAVVRDCLTSLNALSEKHQPEQGATIWTL